MYKSIVVTVGGHWSSGNSLSIQFKAIADELVSRGYRVIILVPGTRDLNDEEFENLIVNYWPSKRPTKIVDALFLTKIIMKHKPVSIIGNFAAVNWTVLLGFLMGVKHRIVWYHTLIDAINTDTTNNNIYLKVLRLRKNIIYSLSTNIVAAVNFLQKMIYRNHIIFEKIK